MVYNLKYFDQFYYINDYSDYDVAKLAKENKIDIAIHRNGYSQNARTNIFSYRVAPLQVNFLGYQGTTGLDFIDYIVADNVVIPKDNQKFYSEKIIYLPNSYYPTYNGRSISQKNFHRNDCLISIGGGITGDISGFAASIFKRGIERFPLRWFSDISSNIDRINLSHLRALKNGSLFMP